MVNNFVLIIMRQNDNNSHSSKRSISDQMGRFLDFGSSGRNRGNNGVSNETVEAKWEQLQYYESSEWQQRIPTSPSPPSSIQSTTSSTSSLSSFKNSKFMKNLKKFSQLRNPFNSKGAYKQAPTSDPSVMMSPDGTSNVATNPHPLPPVRNVDGIVPRIRSAKSLQNLEAITMNGLSSIKDMTHNLKQKYNSKLELNTSNYAALEGDDDHHRGIYDDDAVSTSSSEYDYYRRKF